ncbi:MAG TPA: hypothetical protein PKK51_13550, partial [Rhodocyclaceae bacterium]|nr:hypothetical protein [Rhodocyclaceae bacterium]
MDNALLANLCGALDENIRQIETAFDVAIARRPHTHPETFTRGAAQYAKNLRDHLLIIHGMEDDVVPFQTTVQ